MKPLLTVRLEGANSSDEGTSAAAHHFSPSSDLPTNLPEAKLAKLLEGAEGMALLRANRPVSLPCGGVVTRAFCVVDAIGNSAMTDLTNSDRP